MSAHRLTQNTQADETSPPPALPLSPSNPLPSPSTPLLPPSSCSLSLSARPCSPPARRGSASTRSSRSRTCTAVSQPAAPHFSISQGGEEPTERGEQGENRGSRGAERERERSDRGGSRRDRTRGRRGQRRRKRGQREKRERGMQRNCSRAATGTPVRLQATVKHVACVSRPQPDCHFADTPLSIPVGNSLLDGEGVQRDGSLAGGYLHVAAAAAPIRCSRGAS